PRRTLCTMPQTLAPPLSSKKIARMPFNNNGIVIVDLDGRITFANNFICDLLGTTPQEVMGTSCLEFVFPEDLESAKTMFEANKLQDPKPFVFRLRHTDGSPVNVRIQGTPLRTPNGYLYGVLSTLTALENNAGPQVGLTLASEGWPLRGLNKAQQKK